MNGVLVMHEVACIRRYYGALPLFNTKNSSKTKPYFIYARSLSVGNLKQHRFDRKSKEISEDSKILCGKEIPKAWREGEKNLCSSIYPVSVTAELNPIRHLLTLVGARHIVHVSHPPFASVGRSSPYCPR